MRKPETTKTNIERFNALVGPIMERLVEACPVSIQLSPEDFGLQSGQWLDGGYTLSDDEIILNSTLNWLSAEGFIRGGQEFVITYKGLELYGRVPNRLQA